MNRAIIIDSESTSRQSLKGILANEGFEVLEAIRADQDLGGTRIIVITAKTLTASERRRLSGQIELLLQKGSFLDDDLLEDILATLN